MAPFIFITAGGNEAGCKRALGVSRSRRLCAGGHPTKLFNNLSAFFFFFPPQSLLSSKWKKHT